MRSSSFVNKNKNKSVIFPFRHTRYVAAMSMLCARPENFTIPPNTVRLDEGVSVDRGVLRRQMHGGGGGVT